MPFCALLMAPFLPFPVISCLILSLQELIHAGLEHRAVQGLRLLALYLKAWTEQCDTAQSEESDKMHSVAVAACNTARECIAQEWEVVCSDVLPQVTHPASFSPHWRTCLPGAFSLRCSRAQHNKGGNCCAERRHARSSHCSVCCFGGRQQSDRVHLQPPGPGSAAPDLAGHPQPQRISARQRVCSPCGSSEGCWGPGAVSCFAAVSRCGYLCSSSPVCRLRGACLISPRRPCQHQHDAKVLQEQCRRLLSYISCPLSKDI